MTVLPSIHSLVCQAFAKFSLLSPVIYFMGELHKSGAVMSMTCSYLVVTYDKLHTGLPYVCGWEMTQSL